MDEKEKLTMELLKLMEGMSPEEIEEYKQEWLKTIQEKDIEMYSRVVRFVEAVCEVATARFRRESVCNV